MEKQYFNPNLKLPKNELLQDVTINGSSDAFTSYCKALYRDDEYEEMIKECNSDSFSKSHHQPLKTWLERDANCARLSRLNQNTELSAMIPERILPTVAKMQLELLTSMTEDVLLIGAPTGSGKSVAAPILALSAYAKMSPIQSPGRFLHLTPTGVQANSLASYLHPEFKRKCNMIIGSISGLPGHKNDSNIYDDEDEPCAHAFAKDKTHYCFATHFFGLLAFDSGTPDVLIIDEVHEMTPEIVLMLYKARIALSLPKEQRILKKVILLSATVSIKVRKLIANYFLDDKYQISFTDIYTGCSQFPVSPTFLPFENGSDADENGFPHVKNMRRRASNLIANAIKSERSPYNYNNGVLAFVIGKADLELIKRNVKYYLTKDNPKRFTIYTVSAQDRKDEIELLTQPADERTGHRITLSTSVLESGVTPLSTKYVIDTGTVKYMSMKNRYNVRCIVTLFEDNSSLKQRSGRVGRMDKGQVHYTFTEKRYKSIMDSDHCEIRYNSRFTLAAFIGTNQIRDHLIIQPNPSLIEELQYDMKMNGYMDGDKIKPWVYQLGCGSIGLDVQLLDFVIASQGSGCEIMALLYASAVDTDFHFFSNHLYNKDTVESDSPTTNSRNDNTKNESTDDSPTYYKDGGKNANYKWSREMPQGITLWLKCINALKHTEKDPYSDFESTAEMLFNIMGHYYGDDTRSFPCKPNLPKQFLDIVDLLDIEKIWRLQKCISAHLRCIGLEMKFEYLKHHYEEVDIIDSDGLKTGTYFKLSKYVKNNFRALINRCFGIRVLQRRKKQYAQQFTYFSFPEMDNNTDHYLNKCEGEAQRRVDHNMAVYYSLTKYGEYDKVLRGQLHYQTLQEYVLTGASINATEADFNDSIHHYRVNAITQKFSVQVLNPDLYFAIKKIRLHLANATNFNICSNGNYNRQRWFWKNLGIVNYEILNTMNSLVIEADSKK